LRKWRDRSENRGEGVSGGKRERAFGFTISRGATRGKNAINYNRRSVKLGEEQQYISLERSKKDEDHPPLSD